MIVIKHKQIGDISYVSHIDSMRIMQRAIRRTGVKVRYSGGYNPHMQVYSTHPLPLGVQSVAEYLMVDAEGISGEDFLNLYNANVPSGLIGIKAVELNSKPKLVANVNVVEYKVMTGEPLAEDVKKILDDDNYYIEYEKKGEIIRKYTKGSLYYIDVQGKELTLRTGTAHNSIRIYELVRKICREYGIYVCLNDIFRTNQYIYNNGGYVSADEYLENCREGIMR